MHQNFRLKIALALFLASGCFSIDTALPAMAAEQGVQTARSSDGQFIEIDKAAILDKKTGLMWMRLDYWQMNKKWVNWYTAVEFAQRMNNKRFAGYSDWRFPTADEAQTLYNRRKRNLDKDGDKIFIDRIFPKGPGWSTWTGEEKKNKAIVVSYKDEGGRSYQDKINGTDAFIRLVRKPTP